MSRTIDRDARKAQLAEAVWQVILDHGISAVSVRTVADRAGVVVGSLRHVFGRKAELLRFSADLMVQRAIERVQAIRASGGPDDHAMAIITALLPLDAQSRAELEVNLALFVERTAVPELLEVRERAHRELAGLCRHVVELLTGESGTPLADRQARRLHALIDGLALHLLHSATDADREEALELIAQEVGRLRSGSAIGSNS